MKKRNYGNGNMRHRYRDALDDSRFVWPRAGVLHHTQKWYIASDGPRARPVFGVYALAMFAERMLWRAKFGQRGMRPSLVDAAKFFAETRRALQNVLSTYRIDRRLTPAQTERLRRVVDRVQKSARELVEKTEERYLTPRAVM
jgi:hypothetical protein